MKGSTLLGAGVSLLILFASPVNAEPETIQNFTECSGNSLVCGTSMDMVECFTSATTAAPFELLETSYTVGLAAGPNASLDLVIYEWSGSGAPGTIVTTIPLAAADATLGPHTINLDPGISLATENFCVGVHSEDPAGQFGMQAGAPYALPGLSWTIAQNCGYVEFYDIASFGVGNWCMSATVDQQVLDVEVDIDIKFCDDPNAFNCKSNGALPLTIFGTDTFDVADIDPSTLRLCLEDLETCTDGLKDWSISDRGDPDIDIGANICAINELTFQEEDFLNRDGWQDFDAEFDTNQAKETLLLDFCDQEKGAVSPTLFVVGLTFDGTPFHSVAVDHTAVDQLLKVNH